MDRTRPRIAGMAACSATGADLGAFSRALREGRGALSAEGGRPVGRFPAGTLGDGPDAWVDRLAALVREALADAGLDPALALDPGTILVVGSTKGEISGFLAPPGPTGMGPFLGRLRDALARAAGGTGAGAGGHAELVSAACASGGVALARAARLLAAGRGDRAVVLGADRLDRFLVEGFASLGAATAAACRPFDDARDGLAVGEAAAAVVLVPDDGPGVRLAGAGLSCDAFTVVRPPEDGDGLARAIRAALDEAGPGPVDAICGHGTATVANDAMEVAAFRAVFGAAAPPLFGIKGATGHTLGACGVLEAVASVVAIREGMLPATAGFLGTAAGVDVVATTRAAPVRRVLSVNSGFGGLNVALVLDDGRGPGPGVPGRMDRDVWLHGIAFVDGRDFGGADRGGTWNPDGVLAAPPGALFCPDLARFARMDRPSRFAVAASTLLPGIPASERDRAAVILGSVTGSLDPDQAFAESLASRPLPAVYARTLPSTAGAEVAIVRGLRGAGYAIIQPGAPGVLALAAAADEIAAGRADAAIAGGYEAAPGTDPWAVLLLLRAEPAPGARRVRVLSAQGPQPGDPGLAGLAGALSAPGPVRVHAPAGGAWIALCLEEVTP